MGVFVRRVKTASGATAIQIVHKRDRRVLSIEHIGSAHADDELGVLLQVAGERRHAGQLALDFGGVGAGTGGAGSPAVVEGTASPGPSSTTSAGVVTKPLQLRPDFNHLAGVCSVVVL
jgi:hypothetical protein